MRVKRNLRTSRVINPLRHDKDRRKIRCKRKSARTLNGNKS